MITIERTDLREEWRQLAPAWIREAREGTNPTRRGLLDRPMIAACGDVRGLTVLDCGCGEGRFCRMLLDRGAEQVVGVDLCLPMLMAARQLATGKDSYALADVQEPGVPSRRRLRSRHFLLKPMRSARLRCEHPRGLSASETRRAVYHRQLAPDAFCSGRLVEDRRWRQTARDSGPLL